MCLHLFLQYNGCVWKGGKLRLEKAKEHYLVKLKREWQEESELASKASDDCNADASKNHDALEKPKKPSPVDNTQIHIFFPKLGKVKSLAQVGIGKHKYSFQRIQVPSIPTHFCDCEEHSLAFPPPNKKLSSEIDKASYEVNEQELNIMNSVMNKIFERANPSKQVIGRPELTNGKDELVAAEPDEEDNLTDEDNLIINVANRKDDSMDLLREMRAMMAKQEPVAKKLNTSTEKPNSVNDTPRKKTVPLTKKRKSLHLEETPTNSQTHLDTQENRKTEIKSDIKQSDNNSLRSLKSTWKDLLGQKRKTSFNISDFIASQKKEEEFKGDDSNHSLEKEDSVSNKKRKIEGDENDSSPRTEIGEVATENSIPDVIANDCDKKEEETEADDIDSPLATTDQEFIILDADQKEEEPKTDDLDYNSEIHENDQDLKKTTNDSPVKNDEDLIRTARGEFWRHKSSWTQLISTASHSSFSISHILPDVSSGKHEQQVGTSQILPNEQVGTFDSQPAYKNLDNQIPIVRTETTLAALVKNNTSEKRRILSLRNIESDDTCSFMRTDDSIKQWKKAKASLSGSLNKKKRSVNKSA
ncbi:hypothetical protein SSX86_002981 [Deinandra increscens subsp. villosa]|uniref:Uncharacterized protein n=1 Tax=Deinandra increscens subsp. villosa TaxID=3103831 RepID=A0AAP0DTW1_9ASTR